MFSSEMCRDEQECGIRGLERTLASTEQREEEPATLKASPKPSAAIIGPDYSLCLFKFLLMLAAGVFPEQPRTMSHLQVF